MPSTWTRTEPIPVGGLTCVGFGDAGGEQLLLVVSHNGRGVLALDGTRVARDISTTYAGLAPDGTTAVGIGPLDGQEVAVAGLWGGALPETTSDGWAVERTADDRVLLRPPAGEAEEIHHETLFELRAVGFSPDGAALVVASSGELTLLTRVE